MDPIRIAHISDLHFGADGQDETWAVLTQHLRRDVKPDLVLVTGDIVDTPKHRLYDAAKGALDNFCQSIQGKIDVQYYACPGNHDRFPKGNRLAKLFGFGKKPASEFTDVFQGHILTLAAKDIELGPAENRWSLRLLGLDSTRHADFFARGYVRLDDIDNLRNAMANADHVDLALLLVHHHLIPIRSLETARTERRRDLLDVTSLVNAGSLVEALAAAHVDIALHGHEHAANWGRYATLEEGGGETNIIAAGSATGTVTLERCDISKASYNLIELNEDRTVRLSVQRYDSGSWTARHFEIYDPQALRRARFMRRTRGQIFRAPNSDVTKFVEFTRERDGIIREIRTQIDFSKQPTLTITPSNTTGIPTELAIVLSDESGKTWEPPGEIFFKTDDAAGRFYFQCEVPEEIAKVPQKVEFSYRWAGGAALTAEDLEAIPPGQKGFLRNAGWEFGASRVDAHYNSLRLVIRIPPDFAPPDRDVAAFVHGHGIGESADGVPQHDVRNALRILGDGLYALVIPYPRLGLLYGIKWRPLQTRLREESDWTTANQFVRAARRAGNAIAEAFHGGLAGTPLAKGAVSVYVPSDGNLLALDVVGVFPEGMRAPTTAATGYELSPITQAWRGAPSFAINPSTDPNGDPRVGPDFLPGELALITLPVRLSLTWTNDLPWALVRIAIRDNDALTALEAELQKSPLHARLVRPIVLMLSAAGIGSTS
jgi:UDP-2,3-diacylglucosamine pyrophosphatase LpxH